MTPTALPARALALLPLLALARLATAQAVGFADGLDGAMPAAIARGVAAIEGVQGHAGLGTAAGVSIPIPNDAGCRGLRLFLQGWALAPGSNAVGLVPSNGLRVQIGR